jgi:hypothetical protein
MSIVRIDGFAGGLFAVGTGLPRTHAHKEVIT